MNCTRAGNLSAIDRPGEYVLKVPHKPIPSLRSIAEERFCSAMTIHQAGCGENVHMASWSAYPAEGTVPKGCGENRLKGEFTAKGLAEKQSCCPAPAAKRVVRPVTCRGMSHAAPILLGIDFATAEQNNYQS